MLCLMWGSPVFSREDQFWCVGATPHNGSTDLARAPFGQGQLVSDGGDVNCRDGELVSSGITQIMVLSPISKVALHTTLQQQSKQSFSPQSNRQHCRPPLYTGHNTERIYTELVPPKDSVWLPCCGVNWKKEEVILMSAVNKTQWSSFITDSDAASSVGAYSRTC